MSALRVALCALMVVAGCASGHSKAGKDGFADTFDVNKQSFSSVGRNDYFILEPGYQLVLEGEDEGKAARLIITVLDDTKVVDGVQTRIVEERESAGGQIVEISRNFFAIDRATGDVYYFGEDVDVYKDGKVSGHPGGWQSGSDGAHYGLFMPAKPSVVQKFYQEIAPNVAMDRCEIVSADDRVEVPAGRFEKCVKIQETTPLDPGTKEHKYYAPGVGLLIDGPLKLVRYGPKTKLSSD